MDMAAPSRPGQTVQEFTISLGREDWRERGDTYTTQCHMNLLILVPVL